MLVAEDHPLNQVMIRVMLESAGHQVDLVETGMQALDAVRTRPYDIVLMDISMPDMDGVQATRRIRELEGPESQIPIIALTANAMKGDRENLSRRHDRLSVEADPYPEPDRGAGAPARAAARGVQLIFRSNTVRSEA